MSFLFKKIKESDRFSVTLMEQFISHKTDMSVYQVVSILSKEAIVLFCFLFFILDLMCF